MTRIDIINKLLAGRPDSRYLEIGVRDPRNCFDLVKAVAKTGVDPSPVVVGDRDIRVETSDAYFAGKPAGDMFDVVFVDGLHEARQAYRDICNAMASLRPGGAVVVHDCLPPTEWHQRPASQYRRGESWYGDTWRAAVAVVARHPWWDIQVVDTDCGCAVIRRLPLRVFRQVPAGLVGTDPFSMPYADFDRHRGAWLETVHPSGFRA